MSEGGRAARIGITCQNRTPKVRKRNLEIYLAGRNEARNRMKRIFTIFDIKKRNKTNMVAYHAISP